MLTAGDRTSESGGGPVAQECDRHPRIIPSHSACIKCCWDSLSEVSPVAWICLIIGIEFCPNWPDALSEQTESCVEQPRCLYDYQAEWRANEPAAGRTRSGDNGFLTTGRGRSRVVGLLPLLRRRRGSDGPATIAGSYTDLTKSPGCPRLL